MALSVAASAPGRCGIVGNPSDIYGGKVLSCSIPARARCRLTLGEELLPEDLRLWNAAARRFPPPGPVRVEWSTSIPRSSGLSGSTALLAATLLALADLRGETPDLVSEQGRIAFAELVRDVERNDAQIVCGYQDAQMIVLGGLRLMDFGGKRPDRAGLPPKHRRIEAPLPFLLVTTGVERLSGAVHGPMAERWLAGEPAVVAAMARLPELAEAGASALERGDLATLGEAMTENHRLVADLGGSGEAIERLIASCRAGGARAAKLAGAGLGGTVIALADDPNALEARLRGDGYDRFLRPSIEPGLRLESALG